MCEHLIKRSCLFLAALGALISLLSAEWVGHSVAGLQFSIRTFKACDLASNCKDNHVQKSESVLCYYQTAQI